ncbi:MAG: hypothetical protein ABI288_07910 [Ginsengibacter sp.]
MSTDEAQSLARIHIDLFIELVPAGHNDGVPLYKISPIYFDKSTGAPVIQLISISYSMPYSGLVIKSEINYLNRSIIYTNNQLDYDDLKETIR